MNVVMISIGAQVLTDPSGDVRTRHLEYARRAGTLTMIVSSFRPSGLRPVRLSSHLDVLPTNSRNKAAVVWDAYRLGIQACAHRRPDLIVTQDPFATGLVGYALARRTGAPILVGNHSYFLDNPNWLEVRPVRHRLFNAWAKWLIRRADGLRLVNSAERDKYVGLGVSPERMKVIPTPVAIDQFSSLPPAMEAFRRQLGLDGKRMLLWAGNPSEPAKDLPTLLQAYRTVASAHRDVVLILVGDFTAVPHLLRRVDEVGLRDRVITPGHLPHLHMPAYYHACEFYVHSSRYEGLAKVMVEAAASGKAIVSTRAPGVEAIVKDGVTGLLAPVGDAEALAASIHRLLQDPGRAAAMGAAAKALVMQRFSRDAMIDAVVETWRHVAGRRGSAGLPRTSTAG